MAVKVFFLIISPNKVNIYHVIKVGCQGGKFKIKLWLMNPINHILC